ncbi:reverse transcriptase domain-containing protein [Tanacetum coccineum]
MTRSSTKELFTSFKDPKQEFRSSIKLFKTLTLDESSSPKFDLFSDLEEHSKGEIVETMTKTMEEYMCKTRGDYGSDHEDANEHIEQVLEIVDLFHIPEPLKKKFLSKYFPPTRTAKKIEGINNFQQEPNETLYRSWERFKELLVRCPQHFLTDMQEVILFYNGLEVPTRQILDSKGAIPTMTTANAKIAIQEMAEHSQKWHNETSTKTRSTRTSDELAAIQAQLNNLGREIKKVNEKVYVTQVRCELCKGSHYTKDFPLKEEGKTLEEAYYTQFGVAYEVKGYTKDIVQDYEQRLATIFSRQVNRVHILDFEGLTEEMRQGLTDRLRMIYTRAEGQVLFTRHAWRRLFEIWRPLVLRWSQAQHDLEIVYLGFGIAYCRGDGRRWLLPLNISGRAQEPKKVTATNLFYLRSMDEETVNVPYLLRLAEYFGLVSDEGHIGLTVIARELSVIDMDELVRLRICDRLDDTRAWVAPSLERQQVAAARAPEGVEVATLIEKSILTVLLI